MKAAKIKLPFGLNENNIIVHIANVESGEKCNCVCSDCKSPLIAVKGIKIQHHFRHKDINGCKGGLESAIHLAAKKMIMEKKQITLPKYAFLVSEKNSWGIEHTKPGAFGRDGRVMFFDYVQEEKELHGMRSDILATTGGRWLIIEIFYRHKVEDQKIEKVINANISAIEINLSDLIPENVKDWEAFWLCINDPKRIQWLYNAKAHDGVYQKLKIQLAVEIQEKEKKDEQIEKPKLVRALRDLKMRRSKIHIEWLKKNAEMSPIWEFCNRTFQFSLDDMPNFLNLDVPDGDWIFGCDRRIWQTIFYKYFIFNPVKQSFTINWVDSVIKSYSKVPHSPDIIEIYSGRYPDLVPADVSGNMPSSRETLRVYFNHLCELGMLEFSGNDPHQEENFEIKIISKTPGSVQCK